MRITKKRKEIYQLGGVRASFEISEGKRLRSSRPCFSHSSTERLIQIRDGKRVLPSVLNLIGWKSHCAVMRIFLRPPMGSPSQTVQITREGLSKSQPCDVALMCYVLVICREEYGCQHFFQESSLFLHNFSLFSDKR